MTAERRELARSADGDVVELCDWSVRLPPRVVVLRVRGSRDVHLYQVDEWREFAAMVAASVVALEGEQW